MWKIIFFFCWMGLWADVGTVVNNNGKGVKDFIKHYHRFPPDITINKVSFTQKGYIQFLRYIAEIPPLYEYTFCIWLKSDNLTHSHPLLSYSMDEKKRFIRVWIGPQGTTINLEILEEHIFEFPFHFTENHWYHICQSWSSYQGSWNLYMNGKIKASGHESQLQNVVIPGGGDIVVGQEYTDFDKGLDDGIEGDIYGFNFVQSATTHHSPPSRRHYHHPQIFDFHRPVRIPPNKRLVTNALGEEWGIKTAGLRLVESSFNCLAGRGAPIKGREVLVSWTQTPVRVFGGAILKSVLPFCT